MNRNNEGHFNQIPEMRVSRSRFKRKQNIKFTCNAGQLIPFYVDEVLPGDTFSVDTSAICRMSTPIFPVMDNCYMDYYYFFVPNRIVWEHWKQFCGENDTNAWTQETEYGIPQLVINSIGDTGKLPKESSILDYMGIPTKIIDTTDTTGNGNRTLTINALPIRGYVKIWNEWFRDQNIDNPAVNKNDDSLTRYTDTATTKEQILQQAIQGGRPLWVNKFHDFFTSALPSPQKGSAQIVPITGVAKVKQYTNAALTQQPIPSVNTTQLSFTTELNPILIGGVDDAISLHGNTGIENGVYRFVGADMATTGVGATINDLRNAFAVQQFLEADARGGTRYRELIRNHFGVAIDDTTVQIPEYLGGQRHMINVSQVVQTSETTATSPQGNAAAISVTPFSDNSFTKSFQEHGFVIGVCCIRNDNTYQQGIEKMWSRHSKFDYYWPEFAHLGEQAILNKEIFAQGKAQDTIKYENKDEEAFGYQEAWAEYRMKPNRVSGKFRSNAEGTLDSWHYADNYATLPTLSQDWLATDESVIYRTLAVQDQPQFIVDCMVDNTTVRRMPIYSVPGLDKL